MKRAVYTGSFDPITNGHLDILDRGLKIFDEITILVAGTNRKKTLLTADERVALIQKVVKDRPKVKVDQTSGLVMEYALSKGIHAVIRGLRSPTDFEYEYMMSAMNKNIHPQIETVFMMTAQGLNFVSSTMIKELHAYGGDISPYVPKEVVEQMKKVSGRL